MNDEKILEKLVNSYEEIMEFQKEKIRTLEKELAELKDRYQWVDKKEKKDEEKPAFGSLSSKVAAAELKKTVVTPTLVVPTPAKSVVKKEEKPKPWVRNIFFKSKQAALDFADRYQEDFEVGLTKRTYKQASEVRFEIKRNTTENDLFAKGYLFVLEFAMNGADFKAMEELEGLIGYPGTKGRGGFRRSVRLFDEKKEKVG